MQKLSAYHLESHGMPTIASVLHIENRGNKAIRFKTCFAVTSSLLLLQSSAANITLDKNITVNDLCQEHHNAETI